MTIIQAVAVVVLWRSGHFDTLDISRALGGYRRRTCAAFSTLSETGSSA